MRFWALLLLMGTGWGFTVPLAKIAIDGGLRGFGIIFWQSVVGVILLTVIMLLRRKKLPLGWPQVRVYFVIALVGTVVPNAFSFASYVHLDAGIMSILISTVPLFAFPFALAMGNERFVMRRLQGLLLGFAGVMFLIVPGQAAIGQVSLWYVACALVAPALYGFEGNWVSRFGTAGLDPIQVIFGASIIGAVVSAPLAYFSGVWIDPTLPWGQAGWALIGSSVIHIVVYSSYVWLISAAGPVFAVQVGYIVTLSGVFWSRLLLGESYTSWVWVALVLVLSGVFLVLPKPKLALVPKSEGGQN